MHTLDYLDLSYNRFDSVGIDHFLRAITTNFSLENLNLDGNNLNNGGSIGSFKNLLAKNYVLKTLSLKKCLTS